MSNWPSPVAVGLVLIIAPFMYRRARTAFRLRGEPPPPEDASEDVRRTHRIAKLERARWYALGGAVLIPICVGLLVRPPDPPWLFPLITAGIVGLLAVGIVCSFMIGWLGRSQKRDS